jgi:hypothetical protein
MSEVKIKRRLRSVSVTLSTSTSTATTIRTDDIAAGAIHLGTMSTNSTTVQVFASPSETGTFARLYRYDGNAADITLVPSTTSPRSYTVPDDVYGAAYVKFVSGGTHTEGMTGTVVLKS